MNKIEQIEELIKDYNSGLLTCNELKDQVSDISPIIGDLLPKCVYRTTDFYCVCGASNLND